MRDYLNLMHFPLPVCVFSIATIGASLAPRIYLDRLLLTYLAIFFGLCMASYAFDELTGRPWRTKIPSWQLWVVGVSGFMGVLAVGAYLTSAVGLGLIPIVFLILFFILAYNLELFHGRFHNGYSFAVSWGGLTCLGSYYLQAVNITLSAFTASFIATLFSFGLWLLIHEGRERLDPELFTPSHRDIAIRARRELRSTIWRVVKIFSATVFLVAASMLSYRLLAA